MKNSPLGKLIRHPFDAVDFALKRKEVERVFGAIDGYRNEVELSLALFPFCCTQPLCYFNRKAFDEVLSLFETDVSGTFEAIELHGNSITQAIHTVLRRTESWTSEENQNLSAPKDFLQFDRLWHPEYQRYAEHAFNHLTRVPLELLQRRDGKNYQALELANRADKLTGLGFQSLREGFSSQVRNAISHGGVQYDEQEIRYVGRKENVEFSAREFLVEFDSLVDTCSAYVAAIVVFICKYSDRLPDKRLQKIPAGLQFIFVQGACDHPGFKIDGFLTTGRDTSLSANIYCKSDTRSRPLHLHEALHAAMMLYQFGGRYPIIAISIDCGRSTSGCLIVDGDALEAALVDTAPPESVGKVIRANLLWHDTTAIERWIYIFLSQLRTIWTRNKAETLQNREEFGVLFVSDCYVVRNVEDRSVGNLRRVMAEVFVKNASALGRDSLKAIIHHATTKIRKKRIPGKDFGFLRHFRLRPSYVWLRLHSADGRIRALQSRGHSDKNLLAISEWMSIVPTRKPITVKNPHEIMKRIRIRWMS